MLIHRNVLEFVPMVIILGAILVFPLTQTYASENVKWKTFNEKNGIFTIKYPSNWVPSKSDSESTAPINMYFYRSVGSSSFATLSLYADESLFSNVTDLIDSYTANNQNQPKYQLIQPTECNKYVVKGINACSTIEQFKLIEIPTKPTINELAIGIIDEDGVEYGLFYRASKGTFEKFLPVVEDMIKSFNITSSVLDYKNGLMGESEDSQLPPLTESPTIMKL